MLDNVGVVFGSSCSLKSGILIPVVLAIDRSVSVLTPSVDVTASLVTSTVDAVVSSMVSAVDVIVSLVMSIVDVTAPRE